MHHPSRLGEPGYVHPGSESRATTQAPMLQSLPCDGRWTQATIVLAILIPLLWSFGSTLTGARVCAYRDTAHFYYPLYAWTSRCWSQGEIPLWNPQENIGTPVAAEATSAVFYPGQLIFALPGPTA